MTIDVKDSRIYDPFAIEIFGLKNKAFIPSAKDCPFAAAVDQDE